MKAFAIIIPNYNQSHFLSTAFNSLKAQNVSFSTALMDGGSSDQFADVVDKYAEYISFYRSHQDDGQSAAINEGSKIIRGKYLSWLNADDYYFPYTFELVKNVFDRYPDVDIVYGDAIHVDPDGHFLSYFPPAREFDARELSYNCFICQPACFMRSEAFYNVGGVNPDLHYTMDWDLWCRLARDRYKFHYVKKPLAAVRYYPETKTLSGNYERLRELYRIEKKYGHRFFKRSWLGSYYYGLTFNKRRSYGESVFYYVFTGLYNLKTYYSKKRRTGDEAESIYGFQRWKPVVKNKCTIYFPWYHETPWKTLNLKLKPAPGKSSYRMVVNQDIPRKMSAQGTCLSVDLDQPAPNISIITIENSHVSNWVLESFRVK